MKFSQIREAKNLKGFTLIELLISISILAIISVTAVAVFTNLRLNSRDQRRLRDLSTMKQALELYRSDARYYPSVDEWSPVLNNDLAFEGSVYLGSSDIPEDPSTDREYVYVPKTGCNNVSVYCSSFVLCARKEGSGTFTPPPACSTSCGIVESCDMGISSD